MIKSAGVSFLWFCTSLYANIDQKLTQNVAQVTLYYDATKQFLPFLNWLTMFFRFQNMFYKNIGCFQSWWKTYTKHCTKNYVMAHVKRLSSPSLCSWSSAFNFRIWFRKQKNAVKAKILHQNCGSKNSDFDFVPLLFTLLTSSCLYCSCKLL